MQLSSAILGFRLDRLASGYSPATLDVYTWALDRLVLCLHDPELESISRQELLAFFAWLRYEYVPTRPSGNTEPLSGSSLENCWKAIRSFYNWASTELGIPRPDLDLPRPRYQSREIQPFTQEEVRALLQACSHTSIAGSTRRQPFKMRRKTAKRDVALLLLLLDTGLRVSEAARIRLVDVDLHTGEIVVRPYRSSAKSRPRTVVLGQAARSAVWRYLAASPHTDYLLLTEQGQPMNRHNIRALLSALGKRAGVYNVHPHRFRHTFAIEYLRNGGDVFTLQRLLGHASLDMVRKYLQIAQADLVGAHRRASPVDRWRL